MAPAPKARVQRGHIVGNVDHASIHSPEAHLIDLRDDEVIKPQQAVNGDSRSNSPAIFGTSPKTTFIRRSSSGADGNIVQIRGNVNEMREHLKHLGPSNLASRPKTTRYQTVKIKPGHTSTRTDSRTDSTIYRESIIEEPYRDIPAPHGGEGEGLLKSAGREASDGVQALQQGYGTTDRTFSPTKLPQSEQVNIDGAAIDLPKSSGNDRSSPSGKDSPRAEMLRHKDRSSDTLGSLQSHGNSPVRKKGTTRSGSITENIIEAGGIRKVVLETNSSSSDDKDEKDSTIDGKKKENSRSTAFVDRSNHEEVPASPKGEDVKKKRRRTRKKKAKGGEGSTHGD